MKSTRNKKLLASFLVALGLSTNQANVSAMDIFKGFKNIFSTSVGKNELQQISQRIDNLLNKHKILDKNNIFKEYLSIYDDLRKELNLIYIDRSKNKSKKDKTISSKLGQDIENKGLNKYDNQKTCISKQNLNDAKLFFQKVEKLEGGYGSVWNIIQPSLGKLNNCQYIHGLICEYEDNPNNDNNQNSYQNSNYNSNLIYNKNMNNNKGLFYEYNYKNIGNAIMNYLKQTKVFDDQEQLKNWLYQNIAGIGKYGVNAIDDFLMDSTASLNSRQVLQELKEVLMGYKQLERCLINTDTAELDLKRCLDEEEEIDTDNTEYKYNMAMACDLYYNNMLARFYVSNLNVKVIFYIKNTEKKDPYFNTLCDTFQFQLPNKSHYHLNWN